MNEPTIQDAYAQMEKDAKRFADSLDGTSDFTKKISESAYLAGETFIARKILYAKSKEPSVKEIDWEQRRYEIAKDLLANNYLTFKQSYSRGNSYDTPAQKAVSQADQLIEELKRLSYDASIGSILEEYEKGNL